VADTTKKKKLGFPLGVDENMFYNPIIQGDKIEETPIIPNSELFYSGIKTNTGDYTVDDFVQGAINNSREKNRVVGADGKEYTFDELDDLGISSIDAFFQGYSNNMYGKKAIKKGFELPSPNPLSYQPTIGDKVVYAGADEEGNPILKLVDGNEEDIKKADGIVFDIYGPKPTSRSFTSAFYANIRNALSPVSIGSQLSSFLEMSTDIGEMTKNYLDPNIRRFESEEGTTDDIAEYFSNKKRIDLTSPTLEESEHPWSSAAGISGNLGNAAASMVLYGGYGRALSVFKSPIFSMWGAGLILNTGEAYESAKQSGLDEEDAAMLSLSVGFINTALEQKFGANLVNRWLSGGGSREISKIVLDETKGVLDKATLNAVSNTVYNRVLTGIKNFTEKQIIGSASEEFFEEGMQTLIGKTAEVLYDRAVEGSDKKTFGTRFDKDTWAEIFGSAAIGAIMGGVGGAFVPKGKEANIYDYVIKGKTDQVFAVLDQMKLKGDITPEQFDSYTERLNMLSDLWSKNSTVFKEIKEAKNDKINTAAFSHIDGIFHVKNKLENIDAQIEAVRNDNSLVDIVKEEKIAELELKKINIKDEIQFRESYLKNFIKDSNGKVAVLDNPKIASTKYTNEQFTKFILDKENQSHEETLRAAIAEQQVLDLIPEAIQLLVCQ
jgi:hypothetical protein